MSDFDNVEIVFHGGPHDGTVTLPVADVRLNASPIQSNISVICASWGGARREGKSFIGTVMLLPETTSKKHIERLIYHGQDAQVKYRVDWADVRDDRTLHVVLTYIGTTVNEVPAGVAVGRAANHG